MLSINPLHNTVQVKYQAGFKASQDQLSSPKHRGAGQADKTVSPVAADRTSVISTKPADLLTSALVQLFNQIDTDNNNLVTKEEIVTALKNAGANEKDIQTALDNILSPTTDIDGNGLSRSELDRRIKVDQQDVFAIADLNNDNKVTAEEFENAIALYKKHGAPFNETTARNAFANADFDKNKTVTRAEYNDALNGKRPPVVVADVLPEPISDVEFFRNLFAQIDTDNNGLVTREELIAAVKQNGGSEADAEALIANILSATTDIDGNGLSLAELERRLEVDKGNTFAAGDLNSDGKITAKELETAIDLYVKNGGKLDAEGIRKFFADADINKDNILTKAEYTNYDPNRPPASDVAAKKPIDINNIFEKLFVQFDTNSNGLVTREELVAGLKSEGVDEDRINQIVSHLLSQTTDLNGDGLSLTELRRQVAIDKGDTFAAFDLNGDNKITSDELEKAIKLYSGTNDTFNADNVRAIFNAADRNGNQVLTRAEFNNFDNSIRVADKQVDKIIDYIADRKTDIIA